MPPRRKRSTTTRKTAARKKVPAQPKAAPIAPVVGPGERLFVLSVPFDERPIAQANGAHWDPYTRQTVYVGAALRYGLTPYASQDYSWERWAEDDFNGYILPCQPSGHPMTPRPHQVEAINKIAATSLAGYRGFLEADDVGLGKTVSALLGAYEVADQRGAKTMLIMCPKGVIAHWRRTIASMGDHGLRIVVINYDQAKKLLSVPDSAAAASRTRTKNKHIAASGTPLVDWDIVLADESHKVKNQSAQRSKALARISRYSATAANAPFVIWMSATAGQNPTELSYLAPLLSQLTGATKTELKDFGQWLSDQGFCVTYNARFDKWDWGVIPENAGPTEKAQIEGHRARDLAKIKSLLFDGATAPSIRRLPTDIAGWPEIQRIAHPVELDLAQRALYMQAWTAFRAEMKLFAKGRDPKGGMAARIRFRQKASLIRVPGTVDLALDLIDNGHQVAISLEFHETSDALREALEKAKVTVAEYSGRNPSTREEERFTFQRGQAQVMLFSVTEGISLHQGEALGDGTFASNIPRAAIVHDPRYSGLDSLQIEGRTHRDGQAANVYYTFAAGTVEEKITQTLVGRVLSTKTMLGDDVSSVQVLESVLESMALSGADDDLLGGAAVVRTSTPAPARGGLPTRAPVRAVPPVRAQQAAAPARVPTRVPQARTAPARPAQASTPAPARVTPTASTAPRRRKPAAESMTPEERALRQAMAGGKVTVAKKAPTSADRAAFRNSLRE